MPSNPSRSGKLLANLALAVAAPLVFFALAEGLLAMAGFKPLSVTEDPYVGFSGLQPLFVDSTASDGSAYWVTNPAKLAHFNPQRFKKNKGAKTKRIFTLGGSTTYGHPFRDQTSYTGWLRAYLKKADPEHDYEVVNAGGISYASYREAELMAELAKYEPDAFVVYSGHNEFLEERTYRALKELPAWARTLSATLDRTRTYSALRRLVRKAASQGKVSQMASEVDDVLGKTIGPSSYVRDDSLKHGVLEHFAFSLDRMGRIAKDAGARILYVTTPVNEKDCSPFKSEPTPGLDEKTLIEVAALRHIGDSLLAAGKADSAYLYLNHATKLDPRHAAGQYAAGQAAMLANNLPGKYAIAKKHLRAAIEEDICPLRSLRAMDTAVANAAKNHGTLVDFVKSSESQSLAKVGHDLLGLPDFLDHVHLDLQGYRDLAQLLFAKLRDAGVVPARSELTPEILTAVSDSLHGLMTASERSFALTNLAKVINWAGKHDEAAHLAEQALQLDSNQIEAIWSSLFVGALREREGNSLAALPHYRRAVRLDPNHAESRKHYGGALMRVDSLEAAARELQAARALAPQDPDIANLWNQVMQRMQMAQAMQALAAQGAAASASAAQSAGAQPATEAEAWLAKGMQAEAKGDAGLAIQHYARALQINPSLQAAQMRLARLLQGMPTQGP